MNPATGHDCPSEHEARASTDCICGETKLSGILVCWDCFKHRTDITPFKYSSLSYEDWCETIPVKQA